MKKAKGTFWSRFAIVCMAALFGLLVYWSVDFLLRDIRLFHYPNSNTFFAAHMDPSLEIRLKAMEARLRDLQHQRDLVSQQRTFIRDSSSSLKIVVDNLFRLRDRNQQLITKEQFAQVLSCLDKIITIQADYKATADRYMSITGQIYTLQKQIEVLKKQIAAERSRVRELYNQLVRKQQIRAMIFRLVFLLPLAVVMTLLLLKYRTSPYRLLLAATDAAVILRTFLFVHEYMPSRYFKYILVAFLLVLVGWTFKWLVQRLLKPRKEILLKQYREAYERFLCPVCEYPIRIGPRKYLFWTRRTVHKIALSGTAAETAEESPYTCPACGTTLFATCEQCGKIAHTLLPHCRHCGVEQPISGEAF